MSLPSGYTQLEYIKSSGTQYIDTGFKPNQDTKIVIGMAFFGSAGENVLGSRNSSSDATNRFGIITFGSSSKIGSFFGSTATQSISLDSSIHNYTLSKAGLSVDGASYGGAYTSSFSCTYPITLFAWNNGSNGIVKNSSKIVDCKIFSGEVLVRNFIPCKNSSGVIGLYDVIENQFYQNAGTGSFVAGAEVKGSHKTLIDGTGYDVNAGKCLVGGTAYTLKKGRTLIGGTAYEIRFGPSEYTITLTGSGGTIIYNGVEQNGTFTVTAGDSVTIKARAEDYINSSQVTATISLNGKVVATKTNGVIAEVTYIYTPSANATITRMTESGWKATQRISIIEE